MLRPGLPDECGAQYDDAIGRPREALVDRSGEAITNLQREIVVPDTQTQVSKSLGERTDEGVLVLRGMRDENVPHQHHPSVRSHTKQPAGAHRRSDPGSDHTE